MQTDGQSWIACRPRFFLPVPVLSRLFRRLFLARLQAAHAAGRLQFFGPLGELSAGPAFAEALRPLRKMSWVVYAKPPFGSPAHVLAYLGRYTHRVAIANSRLVSIEDGAVSFSWRDYRHGNAQKQMTVSVDEFIRRFLLHCLPDSFHRIRHYGFLANGCRRARLSIIRPLLASSTTSSLTMTKAPPRAANVTSYDPTVCPCCGGTLRIVATLPREPSKRARAPPGTS